MAERVVVISDTHLGFEDANVEELESFIQNEVSRLRPDEFVLNGDIVDLWRRGIEPVMAEFSSVLSSIKSLEDRDINTRLIAGNHDWRWLKSSRGEIDESTPPWTAQESWEFSSGGDEFVVEHGHKYDLANNNPFTNRGLCLTNERQAQAISDFYDRASDTSPTVAAIGAREPLFPRPNLSVLANLADPNQLASPEMSDRVERIERRAVSTNERYPIIGHTHTPKSSSELVNSGSWTGEKNTYVLVDAGDVELLEF